MGEPSGESKVGDTKDSAGYAVELDTSQQSVNGKSLASREKTQSGETVEDNLSRKKTEKSAECGSLGVWRKSKRILHVDATGLVNFVKFSATGAGKPLD